MNKTAVILINTGTPDSPEVADVRKYLRQFLGDGRIITMPAVLRKMLVNGIIVPFRSPKSSRLYKKVWTENGSPLLWHSQNLRDKLQVSLGDSYGVMLGMRYGNPSLKNALEKIQRDKYSRIILIPLFPQYASSTSGSAIAYAFEQIRKWEVIPDLRVVGQFYNNKKFIDLFRKRIQALHSENYDHIVFSYHGLPLSHVNAVHQDKDCENFNCTKEINDQNSFCYHATCYATTRMLAQKLSLKPEDYTVCFQSRFSKNWLSPFADDIIKQKALEGTKNILVVSPAFVTDCLETIMEIGDEYRQLFYDNGGQKFEWVRSLNDSDDWVDLLTNMIVHEKTEHKIQ